MAAATLRGIAAGIETRLETITSPRVRASNISPDSVDVPTGGAYGIVGLPEEVAYHRTMGNGRIEPVFTATILVSAAGPARVQQLLLADFMNPAGASSVRAAIEGDKTLGGAVEDCIVTRSRTLGQVTVGQNTYLGAEFFLQIIALGA
jgi:hypothetical protein